MLEEIGTFLVYQTIRFLFIFHGCRSCLDRDRKDQKREQHTTDNKDDIVHFGSSTSIIKDSIVCSENHIHVYVNVNRKYTTLWWWQDHSREMDSKVFQPNPTSLQTILQQD